MNPLSLFSYGPYGGYYSEPALSPQGFFGDLVGRFAQPVGGVVGGMLGNRALGSQLGGIAGQLGRMIPFGVDPMSAVAAAQAAAAPQQNLELEALNSFMQSAASTAIRKLYDYIDKNSQKFTQLAAVAPIVTQALELFKNKNYDQAFSQAFQAHRQITLLRSTVTDLPAL
jgi:hypothetical protein